MGLTATPERADGVPLLPDFNHRFAAEVRLGEGISRGLLVPFHYFGLSEGVPDLSRVKWNSGRYDPGELGNILGGENFASTVYQAIFSVLAKPDSIRALVFCTGVQQAEFLSEWFSAKGLSSSWVTGEHGSDKRRGVLSDLSDGRINYLFSVDLLNEGVDIPSIDTVIFLRPTESLTVFLQQLGRGLRHHPDKNLLTVLDFVGQANKNYDFTHKFRALLGCNKSDVSRQISEGYPDLPPGCSIILERQAERQILNHIKSQIPSTRNALMNQIIDFQSESFSEFLKKTEYQPEFLLKYGFWSDLRGLLTEDIAVGRVECLRKWVFNQVLQCNDQGILDTYIQAIESGDENLPGARLMVNLWATYGAASTWQDKSESWQWFVKQSKLRDEIRSWLLFVSDRVESRGFDYSLFPNLRQYCSYDFNTIAWAQGRDEWNKSHAVQGGFLRVQNDDGVTSHWNLFVTIKKTESDYSRDTLYRDWALTPDTFHWESPNNWTPGKGIAQRFLNEIVEMVPVHLFVRELKKDKWGRTPPYLFFGAVRLQPETVQGERPISMRFKLSKNMPIEYFRLFCQEAVS